jgi:non-specific serine/threonine protein kinase/serine/threonine-protein kinase
VTPERWREVQALLHAALKRPPPERAKFLREACTGDKELESEVASLLSSSEEAGDFLEVPPEAPATGDEGEDEPLRLRIGPYQVERLLGRGGMGHVLLARRADEQFEKRVAIKIVKRGMDTDFVLRRFRQERQILAGLDHPNIARLLDGGSTEDGLPYFVMEYVEGDPITAFCKRRNLSVPERLRLFRTVCAAVHFAHQNLVVHRDLKPGNILVTTKGIPKLLDFGIAKLLNPEQAPLPTEMTVAGLRLFTPNYASPEQILGERITTSCDIYSLGVLLYELLTGHRPYRLQNLTADAIGKVLEKDPERPSSAVMHPPDGDTLSQENSSPREPHKLRRLLSGDLDTVVLKAMRKEPDRRYGSAEQLSEDLRRHLEGLPVTARKDTLGYRAGKFLCRHRLGVAAVALILLALVGGIVATSWQARIAEIEHERAERRLKDVRRLANSFLFEFHNAIANLAGSTTARELLVKRALEYLGTLAQETQADPSLRRELAEAYEKLGAIQGGSGANLGDTAGAISSYRTALGIREAVLAADPKSPGDAGALASCLETLAGILGQAGNADESLRLAERALAIREGLVKSDPGSRVFRWGLARAHFVLSVRLGNVKKTRERIAEMERSREIYEALSAEDPKDLNARRSVALTHKYIASAHTVLGEAELALEGYRRSEAIERELVAADPTNARSKQDLSHSYGGIGEAYFLLGRIADAAESYRKAIAIREELFRADPKNMGIRTALARGYHLLGLGHARFGDPRAALESLAEAISIYQALAAADPSSAQKIGYMADCYLEAGLAHDRLAKMAPPGSKTAASEKRRAREGCLKAREMYVSLEKEGKLTPQVRDALDEADRRLALAGSR